MLQSQSYDSIPSLSNVSSDRIRVEESVDDISSEMEDESLWKKFINFCLRRK